MGVHPRCALHHGLQRGQALIADAGQWRIQPCLLTVGVMVMEGDLLQPQQAAEAMVQVEMVPMEDETGRQPGHSPCSPVAVQQPWPKLSPLQCHQSSQAQLH